MKGILGYRCTHNLGTNVPMNIDKHLERLKENLEVLDEAITKEIVKRQRTIGFNTSAAATDMLEIFLHKNNLIDPGFVLKHEWFKANNKIKEKLPFDFDRKQEILELMHKIEEKRDALCYGIPKKEEDVKEVISKFHTLKKLLIELGVEIE